MLGFIRFLLALLIAVIGWNAGARLQVFDGATLVMNDAAATTYKGRISRELLTGDWRVQVYPQVQMVVSAEDFGALAYRGSGLNGYALCAVFVSLLTALFVGMPGLAGALLTGYRHRRSKAAAAAPT